LSEKNYVNYNSKSKCSTQIPENKEQMNHKMKEMVRMMNVIEM